MNLFLTAEDQIINLDCIAAIEIRQYPADQAEVHFHLQPGMTIITRVSSWDAASSEKWRAYQQLKQTLPVAHSEFDRVGDFKKPT